MTISNGDRVDAASVISTADSRSQGNQDHASYWTGLIDALIAHGWEPKPKLSRRALFDLIFKGHPGRTLHAYESYFEALGFEVTE